MPLLLSQLMDRAGLDAADYDVTDPGLASIGVRGLAISQIGPTRTTLENLQTSWLLQASSSDKIRIRTRPTSVSGNVASADLGYSDDGTRDPFPVVLANELEIPASVSVSYLNASADYSVATEISERIATAQEESTTSVQLPIGMTPAEAKATADRLVFDPISSVMTVAVSVPLKYAAIEPGDSVNVISPQDGLTYRLRVTGKRERVTDIEWQCVIDDPGSILSSAVTDTGYISVTDPTVVAPTDFAAMDIPLLRDADDAPGYYAAVTAHKELESDSWPGAVFVQAFTPEQFEQVFTSGNSAIIGRCLTTLPDFTMGAVFDEFSALDVQVPGTLSSSTRTTMLNDQTINAALVGNEVVRFRLATLLSTNGALRTYRLSGFLRGGRGTERHISTHNAGERFVLLRASDLRRVGGTLSQINLARDVKAVTLNQLLSSVTAVSFTDTGESLRPFSPANPRALADGTDMDVSWQRRTRRETSYGGAVDQVVPLGEATELYRIRVFDGSTLVRTATSTTTAWTYAAADIAADGFVSGDAITFEIRQVSAVVGDGHPATITRAAP